MTQEKWDSNAVGHSSITVLMATAASGSLSHMCKGLSAVGHTHADVHIQGLTNPRSNP